MKNFMQVIIDNWEKMFDSTKAVAFMSVQKHVLKLEVEIEALQAENAALKNKIADWTVRYVNIK